MNKLCLYTRGTENPQVFDTYWRTGLTVKGRVRVTMLAALADAKIAAELSAARYLLQDRNCCGHKKAGKGLTVAVSFGAIRKLLRVDSDKSHLAGYANFLRTRFIGAEVMVDNRDVDWVNADCDREVTELTVAGPVMTTITVGGFGTVELTGHAVDQYIDRFGCPPTKAWHKLREIAMEAMPVDMEKKKTSLVKHRREGMFAVNANRGVLMVIAPSDKLGGLPRLVTIYQPDRPALMQQREVVAGRQA